MSFSSEELQKFQRQTNTQVIYSCLFILYMYKKVLDQIKQNKKLKSLTRINTVYNNSIKEVLKSLHLLEYIDIICVSKVINGNLEISASLINISGSEFGEFFIKMFTKIKNFITNNRYTIELDIMNGSYFIRSTTIWDDGVVILYQGDYEFLKIAYDIKNKNDVQQYGKDFLI